MLGADVSLIVVMPSNGGSTPLSDLRDLDLASIAMAVGLLFNIAEDYGRIIVLFSPFSVVPRGHFFRPTGSAAPLGGIFGLLDQ